MKSCRLLTPVLWAALLFPGAGRAADSVTPDLKAAADGRGWKKLGNLELRWVADAKGKPALRVKPVGAGGVL